MGAPCRVMQERLFIVPEHPDEGLQHDPRSHGSEELTAIVDVLLRDVRGILRRKRRCVSIAVRQCFCAAVPFSFAKNVEPQGRAAGEVIRIATENGARYAGVLADRGTIERGKRADLILVDGDPTQNISDIRKVSYVLRDGIGFAPAEIYEEFGIRRFVDPPAITH